MIPVRLIWNRVGGGRGTEMKTPTFHLFLSFIVSILISCDSSYVSHSSLFSQWMPRWAWHPLRAALCVTLPSPRPDRPFIQTSKAWNLEHAYRDFWNVIRSNSWTTFNLANLNYWILEIFNVIVKGFLRSLNIVKRSPLKSWIIERSKSWKYSY